MHFITDTIDVPFVHFDLGSASRDAEFVLRIAPADGSAVSGLTFFLGLSLVSKFVMISGVVFSSNVGLVEKWRLVNRFVWVHLDVVDSGISTSSFNWRNPASELDYLHSRLHLKSELRDGRGRKKSNRSIGDLCGSIPGFCRLLARGGDFCFFAMDSACRSLVGCFKCQFSRQVEIPSTLEIMDQDKFFGYGSLTQVSFASDGDLMEIDGFCECISPSRIGIPPSVEIVSIVGLWGCTSLSEVAFRSDGHLKEIDGFRECPAFSRFEFPASVEFVSWWCLKDSRSLRLVIFFTRNADQKLFSGIQTSLHDL
jgi:hypothetical protein